MVDPRTELIEVRSRRPAVLEVRTWVAISPHCSGRIGQRNESWTIQHFRRDGIEPAEGDNVTDEGISHKSVPTGGIHNLAGAERLKQLASAIRPAECVRPGGCGQEIL